MGATAVEAIHMLARVLTLSLFQLLALGACSDPAEPFEFPDGRIAFTSDRDGDREIYLIQPNGENLLQPRPAAAGIMAVEALG